MTIRKSFSSMSSDGFSWIYVVKNHSIWYKDSWKDICQGEFCDSPRRDEAFEEKLRAPLLQWQMNSLSRTRNPAWVKRYPDWKGFPAIVSTQTYNINYIPRIKLCSRLCFGISARLKYFWRRCRFGGSGSWVFTINPHHLHRHVLLYPTKQEDCCCAFPRWILRRICIGRQSNCRVTTITFLFIFTAVLCFYPVSTASLPFIGWAGAQPHWRSCRSPAVWSLLDLWTGTSIETILFDP